MRLHEVACHRNPNKSLSTELVDWVGVVWKLLGTSCPRSSQSAGVIAPANQKNFSPSVLLRCAAKDHELNFEPLVV